jgi:hypothetical protein
MVDLAQVCIYLLNGIATSALRLLFMLEQE